MARSPETKDAFAEVCNARYGFDPDSDGELEAARRLTEGGGAWKAVWDRYAEAPRRYPNLPSLLDRVEPQAGGRLFEETSPYRPQDNRAEEHSLREGLLALDAETAPAARGRISKLEARHGVRREWVWAELDQSPLARALLHLAALAQATEKPPGSWTTQEISEWYVAEGWRVDAHTMNALAAVSSEKDAVAVRIAVRSLYVDLARTVLPPVPEDCRLHTPFSDAEPGPRRPGAGCLHPVHGWAPLRPRAAALRDTLGT